VDYTFKTSVRLFLGIPVTLIAATSITVMEFMSIPMDSMESMQKPGQLRGAHWFPKLAIGK
jgi:hypothetical protein